MQICEYPVLSIIISCHSSAKKAFSPSIPHPLKKKKKMDSRIFFLTIQSLKVYWDMIEVSILSQFFQIHTVVSFNMLFKSFVSRKRSYIKF